MDGGVCVRRLVGGATLKQMITPGTLADGTPASYGLGLVTRYKGRFLVGHSGTVPGYSISIFYFPESKLGVIILCNLYTGTPLADILALNVAKLYLPAAPDTDSACVRQSAARYADPGHALGAVPASCRSVQLKSRRAWVSDDAPLFNAHRAKRPPNLPLPSRLRHHAGHLCPGPDPGRQNRRPAFPVGISLPLKYDLSLRLFVWRKF